MVIILISFNWPHECTLTACKSMLKMWENALGIFTSSFAPTDLGG